MPIVLTLHKARSPADRQRESRTLEAGSLSIGRGPANDWVLQDPAQHLSKQHCIVSIVGGRAMLTDVSSYGVFINGSPERAPRDVKVPLADGDEFLLGDFLIRVSEVAALSSRAVLDSAAAPARQAATSTLDDDPFGLDQFLAPASPPAPLLDLEPPRPAAAARFDPFGPDTQGRDDPFGDPFADRLGSAAPAARPFGDPPPPPPTARSQDPFDRDHDAGRDAFGHSDDMFRGKAPAENWSGPSQPDNVDAPAHSFTAPMPTALPNMDDWDDLLGDTPPGVPAQAAPPPLIVQPAAAPIAAAPVPPAAPAAAAPVAAAAGPEAAQLLAAFLDGAGVPKLEVPADDPVAYFRMVGGLFGTMVESVRDVLISRAAIKGEFGVERTMLRSRDNNALKFSVTPADAVAALLHPGRPGYMQPAQATKEAFDDIKSHQLAVMVGVQAALSHLLHSFDPAQLETRLQKGSRISSLLPGARQARLWEAFCAAYKEIARDADSDFQEVFGREFSRAYTEQIQAAGERA